MAGKPDWWFEEDHGLVLFRWKGASSEEIHGLPLGTRPEAEKRLADQLECWDFST